MKKYFCLRKNLKPNTTDMKSKKSHHYFGLTIFALMACNISFGQQSGIPFKWPDGKRTAVSLTFDDARLSQVDKGTALLDQYEVKGTFYVLPSQVKERLEGWKKAVASGHEIGSHSVNHPCSGNFAWSREKALENYTIDKMRSELIESNKSIEALLGVKPEVFAYPCGQTFVGRGLYAKSYVPVIAELYLTGRGWLDEGPNDPTFCDFAQLTGMEMDGKDFEELLPLLQRADKTHQWLVLAGHEMGDSGQQTTRLSMLQKLLEYAKDPVNGIWIAPIGTVAKYIKQQKN
jgi:peptidoglycan-N-acetylglucosamine deacetylase